MKRMLLSLLALMLAATLPLAALAEDVEFQDAAVEAILEAEAPEALPTELGSANEVITIDIEALRQEAARLEQEGRSEEAAAIRQQIDAYEAAQQAATDPATDPPAPEPENAFHMAAKKVTNKVGVGDWFQIVLDGQEARSYKSGNKKVATVSRLGVVNAKKTGSAKITVTLAGGGKWVLTVKVGPATELAGLLGKKFSAATAALGNKVRTKLVSAEVGKEYYYAHRGLRMWGYHGRAFRNDPFYEKVHAIWLDGSASQTLYGIALGDSMEEALGKVEKAGLSLTSFSLYDSDYKELEYTPGADLTGTMATLWARTQDETAYLNVDFAEGKVKALELMG